MFMDGAEQDLAEWFGDTWATMAASMTPGADWPAFGNESVATTVVINVTATGRSITAVPGYHEHVCAVLLG